MKYTGGVYFISDYLYKIYRWCDNDFNVYADFRGPALADLLHRRRQVVQSEKDAKLDHKLDQLQPFIAASPQECVGQLASFGPTQHLSRSKSLAFPNVFELLGPIQGSSFPSNKYSLSLMIPWSSPLNAYYLSLISLPSK